MYEPRSIFPNHFILRKKEYGFQKQKDRTKPFTVAIPWTHSPVASKLGASPLKQSRHGRRISSHRITQSFPMFCPVFLLFYSPVLFNLS